MLLRLMITLLVLALALPCLAGEKERLPTTEEIEPSTIDPNDSTLIQGRSPLWWAGHEYRNWIYAQEELEDGDEKLDSLIQFIDGGRIRIHPDRVYFYRRVGTAIDLARATKRPLAFHVFDHTCQDCLYRLPTLYQNEDVVEMSRNFINVYIHKELDYEMIWGLTLMNSNLTVQYFLPSLRRLRVLTRPEIDSYLETSQIMLDYIATLSDEEILALPERQRAARSQDPYR